SVCIGQVRTYCERPLGFGLRPLMIAAPVERERKAGGGLRIATIERNRAPRQCFFRASRVRGIASSKHIARSVEGGGKPCVSFHKDWIQMNSSLKEVFRQRVSRCSRFI